MERSINGQLLKCLRVEKSWSQEELAIAAGVSPRTIQRLEAEQSGSLRTLKGVASALEVDMHNLEKIPRTQLVGVRWGYAGAIFGVACAVIAVVLDLVVGDGTTADAGIALGIIGLIGGVSMAVIGALADRKS